MKKIALVLVLLLTIGTVCVFAEDESPVSVYVGGSATTSLIFDLDDNGYALSNYIDADVALTFGNAVEKGGDGDVYGELTISNLALTQEYYFGNFTPYNDYWAVSESAADAATGGHWSENPVWTAKVVAGDFYVKVDGNEYIRSRRDVMANVIDDYSLIGMDYYGAYPSFSAAGSMSMGYTVADVASFAVKMGTASATPAADNDFGAAVDVSLLAVENLGVDASFVFATDDTLGLGATVGYDVAVSDMTLTPYAAIDFDVTASSYEVGGGAKLGWTNESAGIRKSSNTKGFLDAKYMIGAGADVAVKYSSTGAVDLSVTAGYLPVENLTSIALFEMADMTGAGTMGAGAYADYTVPSVVKGYGWFKTTTATDFLIGAEYIGIANTQIGAKYASADNQITAYCTISAW